MNKPAIRSPLAVLCVLGFCAPSMAQDGGTGLDPSLLSAAEAGPTVVETGGHHRLWQRVELVPDEASGGWRAAIRSFTELATGLNRWDTYADAATWVPARAEFELTETGHFVARQTAHQLILAPNLNTPDAVDLLAPDGVRLRWNLFGLALLDPASGRSVLLAGVQSSQAEWTTPHEVVFREAFDTLRADVRYTLSLSGLEQDVVLLESIEPAVIADAGFDPLTVRLLVISEFLEPIEAEVEERIIGADAGDGSAAFLDEEPIFGSLRIGVGKAFDLAEPSGLAVPVYKRWQRLEGRQFLVESVDYLALAPLFERLPVPAEARRERLKDRVRRTASVQSPRRTGAEAVLSLPDRSKTLRQAETRRPTFRDGRMVLASRTVSSLRPFDPGGVRRPLSRDGEVAMTQQPGLVIDFVLMASSATNYCFLGDTSYYISGTVNLSGTTTIEGGAVLKYTNATSAKIVCLGSVVCDTAPFRPAVFTSKNDNTVGETIPGSTGNPATNYCANPALELRTAGQNLHDLRFAHATRGLLFPEYSAGTNTLSHIQFVRCSTALELQGPTNLWHTMALRNVLIDTASYALDGYNYRCGAEHLTAHQCSTLARDYFSGGNTNSVLALTNSLRVPSGTTYGVVVSQTACASAASSNGVFQTVGAGGFYLANSSYRNAGNTNLNAALAAELKQKTTYPPLVVSTSLVIVPTRLSPQAGRDTDLPDLGYHYDPIDYAACVLVVTNGGVLEIDPGTAVATFGDYGLRVENYGQLTAEGRATAPIRVARFNAVQEQSFNWGAGTYEPTSLEGPRHDTAGGSAPPKATLRFVEWSLLGGFGQHVYTGSGWFLLSALTLQDCQFSGGKTTLSGASTTTLQLNNNLFARVYNYAYAWPTLNAYQNLFWGGSNQLSRYASAGTWTFKDNAFHATGLTNVNSAIANDHNAYLGTGQWQLPGSGGSDVVLSAFTYTNSTLGRYYQVTTNLYNAGSRGANAAGLYHYTVKADQSKETNSVVEIGFHYVATDGNGNPLDYDGDGFPDYFEDRDGDGAVDSGETGWQSASDLGLRVWIAQPKANSVLP